MGILNRNKDKRNGMGIGLADHGRKASPRRSEEQDSPEQERLTRPDEEADQAVHQLDNPPQAEGDR